MVYLIAGLVLFFGTHFYAAFRSRAPGKDLREKLGYGPYMGLVSLIAVPGFILMVYGFGAARPAPILYQPPIWMAHLNLLLTLPAMILLAAAYLPTGYIKKAAKHPMLAATKLWAFGHLLANGELNSVLLFGSFLAFGVIDRIAAKRRGDTGPGPEAVPSVGADIGAVIIGIAVWAGIAFYLHQIITGIPAMPPMG